MKAFVAIIVLSCMLLPFNNCGAYRTDKALLKEAGGTPTGVCEADLFPTFKETYVPFFTEATCVQCHIPGGQAAHAPFAQASAEEGYKVFVKRFGLEAAPDRIYNKLKAGHYGPTFTDIEDTLVGFTMTWQQAVLSGACFDFDFISSKVPLLKNGTDPVFGTEPVTDPLTGEVIANATIVLDGSAGAHEIEWQKVLPDTTVTFQMEIQVNRNSQRAPTNYTVRNLRIKSSTRKVNVKDFSLLLNDKTYYVTTYTRLNFDVPGDNSFHSVGDYSSGIYIKNSLVDTPYGPEDRWSVKVKTIDVID